MNKLFIILLFPSFMFSQIINIETKEESNKKVFSGTIEMEFDYNKSTEIDWEFINSTYLMWNIDLMTILLINEIDLNRAGDEDFANDGFQHLRVIYHMNNNFAIESFIQNQHDLVHDIENRQLAGLGLRKIFSKLGIVGFSTFYEYEDLVDDFVNYDFRLNIYNKLKFEIFENLKFSNVLYFQPKLEDFFDYRFALEATLIVPLSESLSFNNSLSLSYDSSPAFEIPNTTYQFKNSLKYEF